MVPLSIEKSTAVESSTSSLVDQRLKAFEKIVETRNKIVSATTSILIKSGTLTSEIFLRSEVEPREKQFSTIDERSSKFLKKIVATVNEELEKNSSIVQTFEILSINTKRRDLSQKLVEGIAFPFVKDLIAEFDREDLALVDRIIRE